MSVTFGTDGWRAVIAEEFTFDNVRAVAQAISDYFNKSKVRLKKTPPRVVVGFDTRFLSQEFAKVTAEVLLGNKIRVILTDKPTPTPVVSFAIKNRRLDGGIVITASHNPSQFNGIKVKGAFAGPVDSSQTTQIEHYLHKKRVRIRSFADAQKSRDLQVVDLSSRYLKFIHRYINMRLLKPLKLKVLVDSMYGAGDHYLAQALAKTSLEVTTIHTEFNPSFGGVKPEPIKENLEEMLFLMKKCTFDIGIANDGDADRIGVVRADGRFVTSQQVFALLLLHLLEGKQWRGAVAKTIAGSTLIEKIAQSFRLRLFETPVGFKHICGLMRTQNILLGGEESGGVGFTGCARERDGILAGLLLLEMIAQRKKPLIRIISDMENRFGKYYYFREDVEWLQLKNSPQKARKSFSNLSRIPPVQILGEKVIGVKDYDGIKFMMNDSSWLLLRLSGTEPILRIYCEAKTQRRVKQLIAFGKDLVFNLH
jgi:alpha-D-glucose phosphate-specific phosphoglucomutase